MTEEKELTEQDLLVLEGTDLSEEDAANCTDATLARIRQVRDSIPVLDRPYRQILEAITAKGCSLDMGSWHRCKTTHCLGGWTVTLAGQSGAQLEERIGAEAAARAILRKSRPEAPLPNFYASDKAALAFIQARAAEEV